MIFRTPIAKTVSAVTAALIGVAVFVANPAIAAVCPVDIADNVVTSFGCELGSTSNDQPFPQVNDDSLFGISNWEQVAGPTEVNATSGMVTLPADFWDDYEQGLLVLKDGAMNVEPDKYVGYRLLPAGGLTLDWDSPFTNPANANAKDVSHFTLYGTVTPVPLPAALPLFLSALAGLGFIARRRKKQAA